MRTATHTSQRCFSEARWDVDLAEVGTAIFRFVCLDGVCLSEPCLGRHSVEARELRLRVLVGKRCLRGEGAPESMLCQPQLLHFKAPGMTALLLWALLGACRAEAQRNAASVGSWEGNVWDDFLLLMQVTGFDRFRRLVKNNKFPVPGLSALRASLWQLQHSSDRSRRSCKGASS